MKELRKMDCHFTAVKECGMCNGYFIKAARVSKGEKKMLGQRAAIRRGRSWNRRERGAGNWTHRWFYRTLPWKASIPSSVSFGAFQHRVTRCVNYFLCWVPQGCLPRGTYEEMLRLKRGLAANFTSDYFKSTLTMKYETFGTHFLTRIFSPSL